MDWLNGKKTYLTAILMILVGFAEMFGMDVVAGVDASNAMILVSNGFAFLFGRMAVAKVEPPK